MHTDLSTKPTIGSHVTYIGRHISVEGVVRVWTPGLMQRRRGASATWRPLLLFDVSSAAGGLLKVL